MRTALVVLALQLAAGVVADAQTGTALDRAFVDYCSAQVSASPICHQDPAATDPYKWLLLADACDHDARAAYCAQFASIRGKTEPCVVGYSHRRGRWRPLHALEATGKWAYDTDVNGAPTIVVSSTGDCTAIIEDTKPLTYGVRLGTVEERDNDLLSGLKDLAGLLGDTMKAAVPLIGAFSFNKKANVQAWVAELQKQTPTPTPFERLAAATFALASSLLPIGDLRADVVTALNAVEVSETGALTPVDWSEARLDAAYWHHEFDQLRAARRKAIESLNGQPPDDTQRPILDQAQKVLDRQEDVAKAIASLASVHDRWNQFVVGSRMMTWMVVNLRQQPVGWTKDQVHTIKVAVETPLASDVATRLPKVETTVRFTSPKASMFGIGAGVIITPIRQATYKAIAGDDGVKRITATEHDSRTGQLALFIDWRLIQAWHPAASTWVARPALEGGVAVDTKTPGFFLGASIEMTKWIRLSAGRTWQNVQVLDGQAEHDPVANDDAITLRDAFVGGSYVSVSFAIDELPIFTAK